MSVEHIRSLYEALGERLDLARARLGCPLTLSDEILVAHSESFASEPWERGGFLRSVVREHGSEFWAGR